MGHGIPVKVGEKDGLRRRLTCGEGRMGQVGFRRNLREGESDLNRLGQ